MPSRTSNHESKTVRTTRSAEARATDGLVRTGWEIVERTEKLFGRVELVARREKEPVPTWTWVAGGAVAAALIVGIVIGAAIPTGSASATDTSPTAPSVAEATAASTSPVESPAPKATATPTATPAASASPVTHKEVVTVFKDYFRERAAANVMVGKAVTKVTFSNGVVRIVFDPAAAGASRAQFDATKSFENLASFAATPIAFADKTGDRLRPVIDEIKTVDPEGKSLGSFSRADILALNELSK